VVVDVIRAFTTAAYAFGSGAEEIYLDAAAELIERARLGQPLDTAATSAALLATEEAARTLALGPDHCDPSDIELAAAVDAFDFAMEVERTERGLRLAPWRRE